MREEVATAANFLTNMLRSRENANNNRLEYKLQKFMIVLQDTLTLHYQEHWFPSNPCKGSGYRCIRINHKMDPLLSRSGLECGLSEANLRAWFPTELTMWVDPEEVCYRIGENGSICVLYDGHDNRRKPTASVDCVRNSLSRLSISNSSDEDTSSSPMSMSPPSPTYEVLGSCKSEFTNFNPDFLRENSSGFVEYVSS